MIEAHVGQDALTAPRSSMSSEHGHQVESVLTHGSKTVDQCLYWPRNPRDARTEARTSAVANAVVPMMPVTNIAV